RPVVCSGKDGLGVCRRVIGVYPGRGCGLSGSRAAYAIDQRSAGDGKHATAHVIPLVVSQCRRHLGPSVECCVELEHVLEVRACKIRGTAAHSVKVAIREGNANRSNQYCRQGRTGRPSAACWSCCWRWARSTYEIELTDAGVPVAALGILVDMPEVHAGGGIDLCPRIITPAGAASLGSDSRKHDGFSLRKVTWRVTDETSGVPNRRDDCRVGSGVTYNRVSILIHGYAGHPSPQTVVAVCPVLLLNRRRSEIAAGNIELIPAHGSRAARVIQEIKMLSP